MKYVAAPFKQLIERRLWPVAILLVAALVAIPKLLTAPDPVTDPTAVTNAMTSADPTRTQPIVSTADPAQTDAHRKVLGARKDPFTPAIKAKKSATSSSSSGASSSRAATSASGGGAPSSTAGTTSAGGGGTPTTTTTPPSTATTQTTATTRTPERTYKVYMPYVKYTTSAGASDAAKGRLRRLARLPMADPTALLFLGLKADHETAVFLVDPAATVHGDGVCEPTPENCQRITLKAGDHETATISGAVTYSIEVVRIRVDETPSASAAAELKADEAPGGRDYMRAHLDRVGGYSYSTRKGVLHKRASTARQVAAAAVAVTPAASAGTVANPFGDR